ncbi:hypothetical protein V8G54_021805, partial [Vigna mungo]
THHRPSALFPPSRIAWSLSSTAETLNPKPGCIDAFVKSLGVNSMLGSVPTPKIVVVVLDKEKRVASMDREVDDGIETVRLNLPTVITYELSEGENMQVWSPNAKLIVIPTSTFFLHSFKVQFLDKRIHTGGRQPSAFCLTIISLLLTEQVPFAVKDLYVIQFFPSSLFYRECHNTSHLSEPAAAFHELLALLLAGNSNCLKNEARGQVGGLGSHGFCPRANGTAILDGWKIADGRQVSGGGSAAVVVAGSRTRRRPNGTAGWRKERGRAADLRRQWWPIGRRWSQAVVAGSRFRISKATQFSQVSTTYGPNDTQLQEVLSVKVKGDQNQMSHLDMKVLQLICEFQNIR